MNFLWVLLGFFIYTKSITAAPIQPALQRGAGLFMNYCSGCHSLRYMRYNNMARDLGLTTFDGRVDEDLLVSNLIYTEAKPTDPIQNSMPAEDARQWFGVPPPDLSLTVRARGATWLTQYLKGFYRDNKRPFHSNNIIFPDVAMPNVLAPLQGEVILVAKPSPHLVVIKEGIMTQNEFNHAIQDLVTFLSYVSEPVKLKRYWIGGGVLLFLGGFLIIIVGLKRLYWRNVHP